MSMEQSLIIIKPDAVARGLIGRILSRFEDKGLKIVAMRMGVIPMETARIHYAEHKEKPFFKDLTNFITSGPVVIMALEGLEAVSVVRKMLGATSGRAAEPGSIRGDFGMSKSFNLVHASDSTAAAERELALFFKPEEFTPSPDAAALRWTYEFSGGNPI